MNLENYIESQYRDLQFRELLDPEYFELYTSVDNEKLKEIFASLHKILLALFSAMNGRLPTGEHTNHFWAAESRQLILLIDIAFGLQRSLKKSKYEFEIDKYHHDLLSSCQKFLKNTGGSTIPAGMEKIELYYTVPIFIPNSVHKISRKSQDYHYPLKLIGEGSYALIYKYHDEYYNKNFGLKRAKKELTEKEVERFRREFDEMRKLSSPYILEVYSMDQAKLEYTMEFMDYSLDDFIQKNNSSIQVNVRKNLSFQVLKAFQYLHSKNIKHRDISPKNVLLKQHDDVLVAKISDFGLVKTLDSTLTSINTEFKGSFNDPALMTEGFHKYDTHHETYALAKLLHYIMTGGTNISEIGDNKLKTFVHKGVHLDKSLRYQSVEEVTRAFKATFN